MIAWYTTNAIVLQATMTTLLLALSIQLPLRMGVFSFAGVGCFGIGGYTAAILYAKFDVDTWTAVALGTLLAGILCYLLGLIIHKLSGLYLGMATVAFTLIVAVVATNGGSLTGGASGIFGALGGITNLQVFLLLALVIAGLAIFERGRFGRKIDTVREDPELASALGINVTRYRKLVFLASGLIGGLAGAVTTLLRSTITPAEINFHMVVMALTVIIIGGSSSWLGALIGAIVITWLPTVLSVVAEWESIIYGFLVALAAIFLPRGVLGLAKDLIHRWRSRRRTTPPAPPSSDAVMMPDDESSDPEPERSLASPQGGKL
ncbi:branched-chain amino acid ABC transporter permease [Arthrobacter sp. Marseille-P9274]|uniref:branched-chain amino acid ABC transporter permease n=1 Tax=Arthrobacter sp. Marseille-P9274 TaxID=2866572 RepID=UPI0021C82E73|nr:branched-chain amino acid ABC transporter permease [Arthrobacter sp. Marseille-P9274]